MIQENKAKKEAKKSFDKYYTKFTKNELMHMLLANLITFHINTNDYFKTNLKLLKEFESVKE